MKVPAKTAIHKVENSSVTGQTSSADPITTEVIRHGLNAAAEQMKVALRRTAFSIIVYDVMDFACALYDRDIRLLAQAKVAPIFLGTLGYTIEAALEHLGGEENLVEGDVILSTYAYDIGTHSNDLTIIVPFFYQSTLTAYAAIKAHNMDLGAKELFATDSVDIWQEGTIYPCVRIYQGGIRNEDLYRTMLANSRLPKNLAGDISAQISAAKTGLSEFNRLIEKYGLDQIRASTELMFDLGEQTIRTYVEKVPDGRYLASGAADNDGISDDMVPFEVIVEIKGSNILVDLTNAPTQTAGPINCPFAGVVSLVRCAIMGLAGGSEMPNEGYFRPLEVHTRPGTIFHALPPAPVFMYAWPPIHMMDVIYKALAQGVDGLAPAQYGCDIGAVLVYGVDEEDEFWAAGVDCAGGQGGAAQYGDGGAPLMHISSSGTRTFSTEVFEQGYPFIIEKMEYAQDSAGTGQYRGGLGVDIDVRSLTEHFATLPWERTKTKPFGLSGGGDARPNAVSIEFPDGRKEHYCKVSGIQVPIGSITRLSTGGGGGFGLACERDGAAVLADVEDGYISEAAARKDYPHAYEA